MRNISHLLHASSCSPSCSHWLYSLPLTIYKTIKAYRIIFSSISLLVPGFEWRENSSSSPGTNKYLSRVFNTTFLYKTGIRLLSQLFALKESFLTLPASDLWRSVWMPAFCNLFMFSKTSGTFKSQIHHSYSDEWKIVNQPPSMTMTQL